MSKILLVRYSLDAFASSEENKGMVMTVVHDTKFDGPIEQVINRDSFISLEIINKDTNDRD